MHPGRQPGAEVAVCHSLGFQAGGPEVFVVMGRCELEPGVKKRLSYVLDGAEVTGTRRAAGRSSGCVVGGLVWPPPSLRAQRDSKKRSLLVT